MNNIDFKRLEEILNSREDRANKQIEILREYPYSLISFTLNTPGIVKSSDLYNRIHQLGMDSIIKLLDDKGTRIRHKEVLNKSTGNEGYISVDMDAKELKGLMVSIEINNELGRIFDIDVFDKEHNQMSRTDLGLETRKCLLCNKDAKVCMREKNHTYEELIERIEQLSKQFFDAEKSNTSSYHD